MVSGPLCSVNGYRFYFYFGLTDFKLSMFLGTYRFENGSGLKTGIGKKRTLYFGLLAHPGGGYSAKSCRIPTEQFPDK